MTAAILHRLAHASGDIRTQMMGVAVCGARRENGAKFTTRAARVSCAECREKIKAARARAAEALG